MPLVLSVFLLIPERVIRSLPNHPGKYQKFVEVKYIKNLC